MSEPILDGGGLSGNIIGPVRFVDKVHRDGCGIVFDEMRGVPGGGDDGVDAGICGCVCSSGAEGLAGGELARGVTGREVGGCYVTKGGQERGRKKGGEGAEDVEKTRGRHWGYQGVKGNG